MKIQILWADPRERRFRSGDILGDAEIAELGLNVAEMADAREIQFLEVEPAKPRTRKKESEQ